MKCKKCGTELGQKNICPVCSPSSIRKTTDTKDFAVSDEDLAKIAQFLLKYPGTWNVEFDSFYDELKPDCGYRDFYAVCRQYTQIIYAIRRILSGRNVLTAEIIIRIMDEIPQQYPEINDNQARQLAKIVFSETKDSETPSCNTKQYSSTIFIPILIEDDDEQLFIDEWKVKEGDTVKKGNVLFNVISDQGRNISVEAQFEGTILRILTPNSTQIFTKGIIITALIISKGEIVSVAVMEETCLKHVQQELLATLEKIKNKKKKC